MDMLQPMAFLHIRISEVGIVREWRLPKVSFFQSQWLTINPYGWNSNHQSILGGWHIAANHPQKVQRIPRYPKQSTPDGRSSSSSKRRFNWARLPLVSWHSEIPLRSHRLGAGLAGWNPMFLWWGVSTSKTWRTHGKIGLKPNWMVVIVNQSSVWTHTHGNLTTKRVILPTNENGGFDPPQWIWSSVYKEWEWAYQPFSEKTVGKCTSFWEKAVIYHHTWYWNIWYHVINLYYPPKRADSHAKTAKLCEMSRVSAVCCVPSQQQQIIKPLLVDQHHFWWLKSIICHPNWGWYVLFVD